MDRICILEIDSNLDDKLVKFQKELKDSEQIIHQTVVGNKLIFTIREVKNSRRNLLLEEHGVKAR